MRPQALTPDQLASLIILLDESGIHLRVLIDKAITDTDDDAAEAEYATDTPDYPESLNTYTDTLEAIRACVESILSAPGWHRRCN